MKKIIILFAAISTTLCSFARSGGKITGNIKDQSAQTSIDAASVYLLKANDSSLLKMAVTDASGNFSFENISKGSYIISATAVGYSKVYSPVFSITEHDSIIQIGVLEITPVSKNMKEVIVTAKKPFVETKAGKTVVNVGAVMSNAGSTALEVLEKSPGITVDKDGNVSLKGKPDVLIMIDGKLSYLSGADLTNLLRTMAANDILQIEIMTNPSAKYDAAGNSGIINIKTKKNKQKGFNGNITSTYTQGVYASTNNSINVNYRKGKVNIFATISGNHRNSFQTLNINRHYYNPNKTLKAIFEQDSYIKRKNNNFNTKVGVDFYLNKKTTLGLALTGYTTPEKQHVYNTSYLKNSAGILDSIVVADNYETGSWKNGGLNINFRHQIDSTGKELTADFDYLTYKANTNQHLNNISYTANGLLKSDELILGELPKNINIYSGKLDYMHPLKNKMKMEAGLKSSFVKTNNVANYFQAISDTKIPDYDKINSFNYEENINAGYFNVSKELKKWSVQLGLRLENTNYKGHQYGNPQRQDSSFDRTYTSLFPTVFASYTANPKNQYSFSYGRRISRPAYEDLNPFLFFLDKYTYAAGNPFLKPSYAHSFEITHSYKQLLNTTLNYTFTQDLFTETLEEKGFATIIRQNNFGKVHNLNLSVNMQTPIKKWWTLILYAQGNYNKYMGTLYGEKMDVTGYNAMININNQFKFDKGWSAELSGFYRTKAIMAQFEIGDMGQLNAGIAKQILKNKGTVKLNVKDIFYTQAVNGTAKMQNTQIRFAQARDTRVVALTFTYRFGKPLKGMQKRKTGGASDEQNRVKGTDN